MDEQRRALQEYEAKQASLEAQREAERRRLEEDQARQQREFEEQQRLQQERERMQQEELMRQQQAQMGMQMNQGRLAELEREILSMRGQWERDQMMLERYDAVSSHQDTFLGLAWANVGFRYLEGQSS